MSTLHHDARLFAALGHPNRLALLLLLSKHGGTIHVEQLRTLLAEQTGSVLSQPTISHHLRNLLDAGLIDYTQHGLYTYYFVCPEAIEEMRTRLVGYLPVEVEAWLKKVEATA